MPKAEDCLAREKMKTEHEQLLERFKTMQAQLSLAVKNKEYEEVNRQQTLATERLNHHTEKIEQLQSSKRPEIKQLENRVQHWQQEHSVLHHDLDLKLYIYDENLDKLQDELQMLLQQGSVNESLQLSTDESFQDDSLCNNFEVLHNEVEELLVVMEELEKKNKKLQENINERSLELEQIEDNVGCKRQDLKETYDLINVLHEDLRGMQDELDSIKGKSVVAQDGNSLFAEVNDRRLEMQTTLLELKQKCSEMKEELSRKQKQMSDLRFQNNGLLDLLKKDPLERLQIYEILGRTYRDRILILKNLSNDYEKLLIEKQKLIENGLPNNIAEFTNNLLNEKRKNIEKLQEAIGMEFRAHKMMLLQLQEISLEIQTWEDKSKRFRTDICELEDNFKNSKQEQNKAVAISKKTDKHASLPLIQAETEAREVPKTILKGDENHNKENSEINVNKAASEPEEKKVMFAADTVDPKPNKFPLRKGGRVLQCKAVHFGSLIKKK